MTTTEQRPGVSHRTQRDHEDLQRLADAAGLTLAREEFEAWAPFLNAILTEIDFLSDLTLDDTGPVTVFDPRKP